MAQCEALIETLKSELKSRGHTYADVAAHLDMSEANVKRMFASKRFSLDRLEDVCRMINLDMIGLVRAYEEARGHITYLSIEQEKELVSDTKLLFVAVCVRNHRSFKDITQNYDISEHECTRYLASLDRLRVIELLPNNRIRLLVKEDFHWLPNGPIEKYFEQKMLPEFLKTGFSQMNRFRRFLTGQLSQASHDVMLRKLEKLEFEFNELVKQDCQLGDNEIVNEAVLIAFRPWEYSVFSNMRKKS